MTSFRSAGSSGRCVAGPYDAQQAVKLLINSGRSHRSYSCGRGPSKPTDCKSRSASVYIPPLIIASISEFFPHMWAIVTLNLPLPRLSVAASRKLCSCRGSRDPVHIQRDHHPGKRPPFTVWMHLPILPALHLQGIARNGLHRHLATRILG